MEIRKEALMIVQNLIPFARYHIGMKMRYLANYFDRKKYKGDSGGGTNYYKSKLYWMCHVS